MYGETCYLALVIICMVHISNAIDSVLQVQEDEVISGAPQLSHAGNIQAYMLMYTTSISS